MLNIITFQYSSIYVSAFFEQHRRWVFTYTQHQRTDSQRSDKPGCFSSGKNSGIRRRDIKVTSNCDFVIHFVILAVIHFKIEIVCFFFYCFLVPQR